VRRGISNASKAPSDPEVKAIVLTCDGRASSPALTSPDSANRRKPPGLPGGADRDGELTKPTSPPFTGTALGGGLEVALACHSASRTKDARLGLPRGEVALLPGLPAVPERAAARGRFRNSRSRIFGGDPIGAARALKNGLMRKSSKILPPVARPLPVKVLARETPVRKLRARRQQACSCQSRSLDLYQRGCSPHQESGAGGRPRLPPPMRVGAAIDLHVR